VRSDGQPHIVPIVFVLRGDRILTAVDAKPKRSLQVSRLRNLASEPRVSVLVDAYDEAWHRLWWVRADGRAHSVEDGPDYTQAIGQLIEKYPQYRGAHKFGPVMLIDVDRWIYWAPLSRDAGPRPRMTIRQTLVGPSVLMDPTPTFDIDPDVDA
jgi:PPOX class probable F420-dependent enzyme